MMKNLLSGIALLVVFALVGSARAEEKSKPAAKPAEKGAAAAPAGGPPPAPPKAGTETMALKPLAADLTMTSSIKKGAMGPGSPEMTGKAHHACKWTLNDLWLACEIEDTVGTGPKAMKWMGHVNVGWDFEAKAYRGTIVDNMGTAALMGGKLDGNKLVLETISEMMMMGQPMKDRISFDMSDPKAIKFTDEHMMGKGGAWTLAEEGVLKPAGK